MPDAADRAYRAIAGRARLEVLRFLMLTASATTVELAEGAGLTKPTMWGALKELESLGYITFITAGEGTRPGRVEIVRGAFLADLDRLVRYVAADDE